MHRGKEGRQREIREAREGREGGLKDKERDGGSREGSGWVGRKENLRKTPVIN